MQELRPKRWLLWSAIGGVVIGTLYTLTPLSVWAVALGVIVVRAAVSRLPESERRLLQIVLTAALVARVLVLAAVFLANTPRHDDESVGALFGDEAYAFNRAARTRDVLLGRAAGQYDYFVASDEYGRNSYITLLTAIHVIFGPTPYSMRLLNIVLFMSGALMLFHVTRVAFGPLPALGGLVLLLFLPTLFMWSISLLKEPLYFMGTAIVLSATVAAIRATTWTRRLVTALAIAAGLVIVRDLRSGAIPLAVLGLGAGVTLWLFTRNLRRFSVLLVGGVVAVALLISRPIVQQRLIAGLETAAKVHSGHVFTVGHAYKLLDEGFYLNPQAPVSSSLTLTPGEAGRFVVRAVVSFVTVPLPWQLTSVRELQYLPEQLVWYALVAFLPFGCVMGWRRDPLVACLLVGYVLPTAAALALTNGNVGTLLRLRVTVVPYLVWLSVLGFCAALQRLAVVRVAR